MNTRDAAWVALLLCASASAFAQKPAPAVTLYKGPDRTQVGALSTSQARLIVDVKSRLERQAGVAADLDDQDAYAAVLGHQYAHLTLKHREARLFAGSSER